MTEPAKKIYDPNEYSESNFGIRSKQDLVHIFNVLRNKMYTKKPLAVMREYSTNAMDAHIESGQRERPIEVSLPTGTDPYLRIRDYGLGLSEEDIRNTYTMYGASTKRGSSELNGQLGFGSKAAFCYANEYTIISYHEGKETTFEAYIDESGLGAISKLTEKPSTQTGVEIKIKVQLSDIAVFNQTAKELYQFFTVTPVVKNLNGKIDRPTYSYTKDRWGLRSETTNLYKISHLNAIMGNVGYPLNNQVLADNLRHYSNWSKIEPLLRTPLNLFFKVGDLSIAASREDLEYDKKTLKAISDALEVAATEAREEFNKRLSTAEDLVEAKKMFKQLHSGELSALGPSIIGTKGLVWKGKDIKDYYFTFPNVTHQETIDGQTREVRSYDMKRIEAARNRAAGIIVIDATPGRHFEVNNENVLFIRDTDDKPMLRARKFLADNPEVKNIWLFTPAQLTTEGFCNLTSIPVKHFKNLKDQEALKIESTKKNNPNATKHQQKVFRLADRSNTHSYADSSYWDTVSVDASQEYYYVYLDRFCPTFDKDGRTSSIGNHNFRTVLDMYRTITGQDISNRIIGIKISAADKVKKHWKSLQEVMVSGLNSQGAGLTNHLVQEARKPGHHHDWVNTLHSAGLNTSHLSKLRSNSPFRTYISEMITAANTTVSQAAAVRYQQYVNLRSQLRMSVDTDAEAAQREEMARLSTRRAELLRRYPMLELIQMNPYGWAHGRREYVMNMITDYIKMIDDASPPTT